MWWLSLFAAFSQSACENSSLGEPLTPSKEKRKSKQPSNETRGRMMRGWLRIWTKSSSALPRCSAVPVFVDFLSLTNTNTIKNKSKTNLMVRRADMSTLPSCSAVQWSVRKRGKSLSRGFSQHSFMAHTLFTLFILEATFV